MRAVRSLLDAFVRNRDGSTTILFALAAPALIGMAALATDMGELYVRHRSIQAAVDAAALAAASHPDIAATVARKTLNAAGLSDVALTVRFGAYDRAAPDRDARFVPGSAGSAVQVEARLKSPPRLASIFTGKSFEIRAHAEAALSPIVSLSVGGRLASMDTGLLGGLLASGLGATLNLSATDYSHLARSKIELGALVGGIPPDGMTIRTAVQTPVRVTELLSVMADEMRRRGDLSAMATLRKAATETARSSARLRLSEILRLDEGILNVSTDYPALATQAELSVLDLFNAAMRHSATAGTIEASLPVPGIGSAEVALRIGEAGLNTRALAVSEDLLTVETDAVRLRVRVATNGLLDALQTKLDLPLEVVAGGGSAQVTDVRCSPDPADRKVTVSVRPGIAKLALGTWTVPLANAGIQQKLGPVQILSLLGTGVEAQAFVLSGSLDPVDVTFNAGDIANGTAKTVRTRSALQSLFGTVLAQTEYTVRGLPVLGLVQKVGAILAPLTAPLDRFLDGIASFAGFGLGEIDVRIGGLVCGRARIIG